LCSPPFNNKNLINMASKEMDKKMGHKADEKSPAAADKAGAKSPSASSKSGADKADRSMDKEKGKSKTR
jgi:hypothetical protein